MSIHRWPWVGIIRICLTLWLLYTVWGHTHWSVALALFLVMLEIELRTLNEWLKSRQPL